MSIKNSNKVSSIPRSIPLYESIVNIDIDTSKVSSIISISIFDITNPGRDVLSFQNVAASLIGEKTYVSEDLTVPE